MISENSLDSKQNKLSILLKKIYSAYKSSNTYRYFMAKMIS